MREEYKGKSTYKVRCFYLKLSLSLLSQLFKQTYCLTVSLVQTFLGH